MTKNNTETMIFPLESENQFIEAVKETPIQAEEPILTNESTASNMSTTSYLKKRKAGKEIDTSQPTASLFDIVSDPKLAYSSAKTRKIRKIEEETETPIASTSTGTKQLVLKNGKIEFEQAVECKIQSETPKRTTSASFRTTKNGEKWTEEETNKFYEGLQIFGSDFSMVGILFPKRTRDQIKKKFNREEKSDGKRINEALKAHTVNRSSFPEKLMETLGKEKGAAFDEIQKLLCNIVAK